MSQPEALILGYEPYEPTFSKIEFGGVKTYTRELVAGLLATRFRVAFCINQHPYVESFCQEIADLGAEIVPYEFDCAAPGRVAAQIDAICQQRQPSVIHENSYGPLRPVILRSAAFRAGAWKKLCTMHAPMQTAAWSGRTRWQHRLPFRWYWKARRADQQLIARFDRVISVSEVYAKALRRELRLGAERVVSIPNGVDTARFTPRTLESRTTNDAVVIGAAGALGRQKRFDVLVDAVALIARSMPIRLRIAGCGEDEAALRERAQQLGIGERVEFAGIQRDMPAFLRTLDLFSMTSDSEALPYAQLEAMAAGLPSVVTDVGDLPVVVRDGIDGYVVPRRATERVAERLKQLAENPELRTAMGASARRRACEEYSQARARERTMAVFRELSQLRSPER
jgi:glycosyltransferase involved in cell wall biosynthesis